MRVKLSGGRLDGEEMEVSDSLTVLSCPLLSLRDIHAVTTDATDVKRHSWDDEALNISYLDYYKTDMEADDGTVIFVPKETAHLYV